MSDERKASDVLIDLDNKIDKILAYQQNNDLLYKLLLERVDKLSQQLNALQQKAIPTVDAPLPSRRELQQPQRIPQQAVVENPDEMIFSEYNPTKIVSVPKSKLQKALEDDDQEQTLANELTVDNSPAGKKRNLRFYPDGQAKKVPVQQRVVYGGDGKSVYMAKVEIFDQNNTLIQQTRTNQVGKWLAVLKPGVYVIAIAKSASSLKPKVELSYQITVPDSDSPTVELDPQKV